MAISRKATPRVIYTPPITHPAEHISHVAIGHSLDWFAKTLQGGTPLPPDNQIWFRKEFGTLVALAGFIVLLLGAFQLLLTLPVFAPLAAPAAGGTPAPRDRAWWTALLLTALVPAVLYYPVLAFANNYIKASPYLPQGITNQIATWALVNAVLTLVLLYFAPKRTPRAGIIVPSILIAAATVAIGYLSLLLADLVFKIDFRFWIVALKLMSGKQALMFLIYLIPFVIFFVVAFGSIRRNIYRPGEPAIATYLSCMAALALGFLILCIVQYGALWVDGKLIDALPADQLGAVEHHHRHAVHAAAGDPRRDRCVHDPQDRHVAAGRADLCVLHHLVHRRRSGDAGGVLTVTPRARGAGS